MGPDSFLAKRNHHAIRHIILKFGKKFGVRIYQQSINSNHLHLLLRITNRSLYKAFIKALSGQIASHVMQNQSFLDYACGHAKSRSNSPAPSRAKPNAGDGSPASNKVQQSDRTKMEKEQDLPVKQSFWEYRPFSRIVNWGRDFKESVEYLKQNVLEAFGFVPYKPRKNYYAKWTFS